MWYVTLSILLLTFSFGTSKWLEVNEADECGSSVSDRIVGGENARLGQYPWLARLGYNRTENVTFECGGALITRQHVLTASHCVQGIGNAMVTKVVLGEHDISMEIDCEGDTCADPIQVFHPIEIVLPFEYNQPEYKHDIALIKLSREAKLTQWVRPICLPLKKDTNTDTNFINSFVEIAGWGFTNSYTEDMAQVLQTVKLQVVSLSECKKVYDTLQLGIEQMCVGGSKGKDSCSGDSGGPMQKALAFRNKGPRYFAIGIVSLGAKTCGEFATPALYTNVTYYLPWILKNINSK